MRLQKIGQGAFTTAYKRSDGKVLLKSCDPIKECMAHGWFPNSRLFPKIEFGKNSDEYIMRYYPRHKSLKRTLKPDQWAFYKELRNIFSNVIFESDRNYLDILYHNFNNINCRNKRRIMIEALDACRNYGECVRFEISPRNVAVSDTGNLVLLDCFFMKYKLTEVYSNKKV